MLLAKSLLISKRPFKGISIADWQGGEIVVIIRKSKFDKGSNLNRLWLKIYLMIHSNQREGKEKGLMSLLWLP